METVVTIYQTTTMLLTFYGYWKIAETGYSQYNRTKTLFDITVNMLDKVQTLVKTYKLDESPEDIEKIKLPINIIENINNEIKYYYSKKPFKEPWEILYKEDIPLIEEEKKKGYFFN